MLVNCRVRRSCFSWSWTSMSAIRPAIDLRVLPSLEMRWSSVPPAWTIGLRMPWKPWAKPWIDRLPPTRFLTLSGSFANAVAKAVASNVSFPAIASWFRAPLPTAAPVETPTSSSWSTVVGLPGAYWLDIAFRIELSRDSRPWSA